MSDEITVKSNINEISAKVDKLVNKMTTSAIRQLLYSMMEAVGFRAVSEYMIQTTMQEAVWGGTDPNRLTVRTGRLAGSILSAPRFSKSELPTGIESLYMQEKPKTISRKGGQQEAINEIVAEGATFHGIKGSRVEYAAKHEFGRGVRPRPYLVPALRDSEAMLMNMIEQTMTHQIKAQGL